MLNAERKVGLLLGQARFGRAQRHIVARAKELNWRIYDLNRYTDKILTRIKPDALLTDRLWDDPLLSKLRRAKFPVVRLGRFRHPKDHLLPAVVPDLPSMGRTIGMYFAERNF